MRANQVAGTLRRCDLFQTRTLQARNRKKRRTMVVGTLRGCEFFNAPEVQRPSRSRNRCRYRYRHPVTTTVPLTEFRQSHGALERRAELRTANDLQIRCVSSVAPKPSRPPPEPGSGPGCGTGTGNAAPLIAGAPRGTSHAVQKIHSTLRGCESRVPSTADSKTRPVPKRFPRSNSPGPGQLPYVSPPASGGAAPFALVAAEFRLDPPDL